MSRTYEGALPASMAILGLVIERPDETVSKIASLFSERFHYARFSPSTVYNTLPRLAKDGRAQRTYVAEPKPSAEDRYEATERGVDAFREWVRDFAMKPTPMRDAFYCRAEFAELGDFPLMGESLERDLRRCREEFVTTRAVLQSLEVTAFDLGDLRTELRLTLVHDQNLYWGFQMKRIERLRRRLMEIRSKNDGRAGGSGA
jgi:DNA-binding PadR family transcriptional regulator